MVSASSGYLPESWCNSGGGPTALGEKAESWATAVVQTGTHGGRRRVGDSRCNNGKDGKGAGVGSVRTEAMCVEMGIAS